MIFLSPETIKALKSSPSAFADRLNGKSMLKEKIAKLEEREQKSNQKQFEKALVIQEISSVNDELRSTIISIGAEKEALIVERDILKIERDDLKVEIDAIKDKK